MPKRESTESKIISYFRDEELSKAGLMFGLVKGEMAKRQPKKRKTSKPKLRVGETLGELAERTKKLANETTAKGISVSLSSAELHALAQIPPGGD